MAENPVPVFNNTQNPVKKLILDNNHEKHTEDHVVDDVDEFLKDMSSFEVKQVLRNNTSNKLICVQGVFKGRDEVALVVLEKKIFPDEHDLLEQGFFNSETLLKKTYRNDIYRGYDWFPTKEYNGLNVTVIYPATEKHIEKWTRPEFYVVEETPELYQNVTVPKFIKEQFSLQWVDNILNGEAETERVIYSDPDNETGFVLVKDLKWDDELQTLYLIAITRKRIHSIRDLNETHLPLLRNIKEAGCKAIEDKYKIPRSQLRIFFHYQPSYYHLHVHFTALAVERPGAFIEKGHLLSTVINNIELMSDYYQKAVLPFRVQNLSLYQMYENYLKDKEKLDS